MTITKITNCKTGNDTARPNINPNNELIQDNGALAFGIGGEEETFCDKHKRLCEIRDLSSEPPISCLIDFLSSNIGCDGAIDKQKIRRFLDTYKRSAGIPDIPRKQILIYFEGILESMISRSIVFTYTPLFFIFLIAIWLMVIVGWFSWLAGLMLTVGLIVVLYAFGISYRISVQTAVQERLAEINDVLKDYFDEIDNSVVRTPHAFLSAMCEATGNDWRCDPVRGKFRVRNTTPMGRRLRR